MTGFSIDINPPLTIGEYSCPITLEGIDAESVLRNHPEEYDIEYMIGGCSFRYYPASILTVLNDLHQEWGLVRDRIPHAMTLSGYTVLEMDFEGEAVLFYDPVKTSGETRQRVGEPTWVIAVEDAFRVATEQALGVVHQ